MSLSTTFISGLAESDYQEQVQNILFLGSKELLQESDLEEITYLLRRKISDVILVNYLDAQRKSSARLQEMSLPELFTATIDEFDAVIECIDGLLSGKYDLSEDHLLSIAKEAIGDEIRSVRTDLYEMHPETDFDHLRRCIPEPDITSVIEEVRSRLAYIECRLRKE